jgi:misacylated tRNA(Ala) deacylase
MPYRANCSARVLGVNERGGIILDRTVFYAAARRTAGDKGLIELEGRRQLPDRHHVYDTDKTSIVHCRAPDGSARPAPGQTVHCRARLGTRGTA